MLVMVVCFVATMVQIFSVGYLARRTGSRPRPLLHVAVPVPVLDARPGARTQPAPAVRLLGDWWGCAPICSSGTGGARPAAAKAAVKAFWVTKFADMGLLAGLVVHLRADRLVRVDGRGRGAETCWVQNRVRLHGCRIVLLRGDGQERAVPPARVASRRDGGPHPGVRPAPRRHHGGRGRLYLVVRAWPICSRPRRRDGPGHGDHRWA